MKNIIDVMRQKEQQIQQLQREIEALRVAAKLLADDNDVMPAPRPAPTSSVAAPVMPSPQMVMRPAQPASKDSGTYVAPSAWDVSKPQFP